MTASSTTSAPVATSPLAQQHSCDHPVSPVDAQPVAEVLTLLPTLPDWPGDDRRRKSAKYLRGATRVMDWLQQYPGAGWQERWDAAHGDDKAWMDLLASQDWRLEKTIRDELFAGLRYLMCPRAFRPGYGFFHGNHLAGFFDGVQRNLNPELFASLDHTGRELGMSGKQINDGKKTLVRLVLHTGADLEGITEQNFFELRDY